MLFSLFLPLIFLGAACRGAPVSDEPLILYPNKTSIWYRDHIHNITWDIWKLPLDAADPIIRLYKGGQDTYHILAEHFDLTAGRVEVQVPHVEDGTDYQIKMFFNVSTSSTTPVTSSEVTTSTDNIANATTTSSTTASSSATDISTVTSTSTTMTFTATTEGTTSTISESTGTYYSTTTISTSTSDTWTTSITSTHTADVPMMTSSTGAHSCTCTAVNASNTTVAVSTTASAPIAVRNSPKDPVPSLVSGQFSIVYEPTMQSKEQERVPDPPQQGM